MKKRICSFILVCAMLMSLMIPLSPTAAAESGAMMLSVSSVSGTPGDTVQVTVSVSDNPGIASLIFDIEYDSALTLTNVEFGSAFRSVATATKPYANPQPVKVMSLLSDVSGNGVLATLTFVINENTESGSEAEVNVSFDPADIFNCNGEAVGLTVTSGKVSVFDGLPGDIDGNGKVNTKDAIDLFRYISGWSTDVDPNALDVNGDNSVNVMDAMTLLKYVAGWDGIVLHRGGIKHVHSLTAAEAKAASCTEDGNIAYWYCSACGKYYTDAAAENEITLEQTVAPAVGHSMTANEAKAATCTVDGNSAYWYCKICGKYFTDEAGTTETAYADTVIRSEGHTEVIDKAVEPSCTETGLTEGKHCSVCNEVLVAQTKVEKSDHTPGKNATCTEDQTCTVCGEVLATANGHIAGVEASCTVPQKCTVCQTVLAEATGHSLTYVAERDPVDKNDPGNRAYWQCSKCQKSYLDEEATQEIALEDTEWETYLVYFHDLENDTHTIKVYKQSEVLSLKNIKPVEMTGYDFNSWHTSSYFTDENEVKVIPAGNTEKIDLYANRSLHEYTITMLGLGREESCTYNFVEGKKLTTPKWKESKGEGDCLIFSHWSDENGNKITEIPAGETRDRTIEANWIYKENYAISNPYKYTYVSGILNSDGKYSFIYEIGQIKNLVLSKQHTFTFDGLTEHTESKTTDYTVGVSEGQAAAQAISKIVSNSTENANIEVHTTTHSDGWEVGTKWKPEVEFEGIKVSAWEFSGGYSNSDTDTYENTGFTSEKNYEEYGTEDEIRSTIDFYTEESVGITVSDTFIPGVTPVGNYTWARLMDVKVYAIVTYNPYIGNYVFDVYSVPTNIHNGLLYTLPSDLEYEVNIVSGDILDFEIPFDEIPEMFYTVEYDSNSGAGTMNKSVHEIGVFSRLLTNQYTKTGYTFAGWKLSVEDTVEIYTDAYEILSDIAVAGETVKLYAHWIPNTYTIKYDPNGGIGSMQPSSHTYDVAKALSTNTFTRTGYTFQGWSKDSSAKNADYVNCEEVKNLATGETESDSTVTLYAVWKANTYTITYDANGGSGNMSQTKCTYDVWANVSSNSFSRNGWIFDGWNTNPDGSGESYSEGQSVRNLLSSGSMTLYAIWAKTEASAEFPNKITLGEGESHDDWINTGMSKEALLRNNYTTIEIVITFAAAREDLISLDKVQLAVISNGKATGFNAALSIFSRTETNYKETYTIDIETHLNDDGSLMVHWEHFEGNGNGEHWFIYHYEVTATAK